MTSAGNGTSAASGRYWFMNRIRLVKWICCGLASVLDCSCGEAAFEGAESGPGALEEEMSRSESEIAELGLASGARATDSSQAPPEQCSEDKLRAVYQRRFAQGESLMDAIWERFQDCGRIDKFVDRVMTTIEALAPDHDSDAPRKRCRYAGLIDGVLSALDTIQQNCVDQCFLSGDLVGAIEGKLYCDLILDAEGDLDPVPWVRQPVGTCGLAYEFGCDARFLATTRSYTHGVDACYPYTIAPYFEVWEASRMKLCDAPRSDD